MTASSRPDEAITVAVTFRVMPGQNAAFERWAHEITMASRQYPGHLGHADHARRGDSHDLCRDATSGAAAEAVALCVRDDQRGWVERNARRHPAPSPARPEPSASEA